MTTAAPSTTTSAALSGDTNAALTFIKQFRPSGTICLVVIAENGQTNAHTFDVKDVEGMRTFIDVNQGRTNLYFTVNNVKGSPAKKPTKDDMAEAVAQWVDLDPREGHDLADERRRIADLTAEFLLSDAPPSYVIDSGGGYQLFWTLDKGAPLDGKDGAATKQIEAVGRRLEIRFGADHVRNVDRVMRLPGTINVPNAKKRAKGRKPALAKLISGSPITYSLNELRELSCWSLEGIAALRDLPELQKKLLKALATNDKLFARWCGNTEGLADKSRSGFQMSIGAMLKASRFDKADLHHLLSACPHATSDKLDERQIDRIWDRTSAKEGDGDDSELPQRDRLLALRHEMELWHDKAKSGFATIRRDGHFENHRVKSKEFRGWLVAEHMARGGKAPSNSAIGEALNGFEAFAYSGEERDPRIRTAEHDGKIYLDIGRAQWDAIEVDANGWRIVERAPIPFLRPSGMLALPEPERGGKIRELRPYVNLARDEDFGLFVACVLAALRPRGPYPILNPVGEGGSAKTSLCRVFRALTDPNVASVTKPPKSEDDLQVDAACEHVLAYDNLSRLSEDMADALCRVATGAGLGKRQLYTDSDRHVLYACRPVLLNGISDLAQRDDLSQRTISLFLQPIPDEKRKTELDFDREFAVVAPRIFGALLDGLSHGLKHLTDVKAHPPRLADFTIFAMAAIGAYGWSADAFLEIMREYRATAAAKTAEADTVAREVRRFMEDLSGKSAWQGTATELLSQLNDKRNAGMSIFDDGRDKRWPKDGTRLSGRLRRIGPALRALGIDVRYDLGKERTITITRTAAASE